VRQRHPLRRQGAVRDRPGAAPPDLRIETGAGVLACAIDVKDGAVDSVAVDMGRPR
jgi:hypothetical protein